jgi:hypothetical protein
VTQAELVKLSYEVLNQRPGDQMARLTLARALKGADDEKWMGYAAMAHLGLTAAYPDRTAPLVDGMPTRWFPHHATNWYSTDNSVGASWYEILPTVWYNLMYALAYGSMREAEDAAAAAFVRLPPGVRHELMGAYAAVEPAHPPAPTAEAAEAAEALKAAYAALEVPAASDTRWPTFYDTLAAAQRAAGVTWWPATAYLSAYAVPGPGGYGAPSPGKNLSRWYGDGPTGPHNSYFPRLPHDWYVLLENGSSYKKNVLDAGDAGPVNRYDSVAEAVDAAGRAFLKLPPARQSELLAGVAAAASLHPAPPAPEPAATAASLQQAVDAAYAARGEDPLGLAAGTNLVLALRAAGSPLADGYEALCRLKLTACQYDDTTTPPKWDPNDRAGWVRASAVCYGTAPFKTLPVDWFRLLEPDTTTVFVLSDGMRAMEDKTAALFNRLPAARRAELLGRDVSTLPPTEEDDMPEVKVTAPAQVMVTGTRLDAVKPKTGVRHNVTGRYGLVEENWDGGKFVLWADTWECVQADDLDETHDLFTVVPAHVEFK